MMNSDYDDAVKKLKPVSNDLTRYRLDSFGMVKHMAATATGQPTDKQQQQQPFIHLQ